MLFMDVKDLPVFRFQIPLSKLTAMLSQTVSL